MLEEYAILPDVFDASAYSNESFIEICLPSLKDALLHDGALVRDLCGGVWSRFCAEHSHEKHRYCKEILKKLKSSNRLRSFPQPLKAEPKSASDWCLASLASAADEMLTGIIASHATKQNFADSQVASIEKLNGTNWWQERGSTMTVPRATDHYKKHLSRLLSHANSLMFIDPNLQPDKNNYREFGKIFESLAKRRLMPRVEIHTQFFDGNGRDISFPTIQDWKNKFQGLSSAFESFGLTGTVYFWGEFHARFLITDVIGICFESGFDIVHESKHPQLWSLMSRKDKDYWQRMFDPAAKGPKFSFSIGIDQKISALSS